MLVESKESKMKIENLFIGDLIVVTNIRYSLKKETNDTLVERSLRIIKANALLLRMIDDHHYSMFEDLESKENYFCDISSSNLGNILVDPRSLMPLSSVLDIDLVNKRLRRKKVVEAYQNSSLKLQKTLKKQE